MGYKRLDSISWLKAKLAEVKNLYNDKHGNDADEIIVKSANGITGTLNGRPSVSSLKAKFAEVKNLCKEKCVDDPVDLR